MPKKDRRMSNFGKCQQGYKVFHYTGSEIVANPFGIAHEVIREITKSTSKDSAARGFII